MIQESRFKECVSDMNTFHSCLHYNKISFTILKSYWGYSYFIPCVDNHDVIVINSLPGMCMYLISKHSTLLPSWHPSCANSIFVYFHTAQMAVWISLKGWVTPSAIIHLAGIRSVQIFASSLTLVNFGTQICSFDQHQVILTVLIFEGKTRYKLLHKRGMVCIQLQER